MKKTTRIAYSIIRDIRKKHSVKCRVQYFWNGSKEAAFIATSIKNKNVLLLNGYSLRVIIGDDLFLSHVLKEYFD